MHLLSSINEQEWSSIANISSPIFLKKNEMILRQGDHSAKEFFLESGIVRGFIIDEDGNEKSTAFFQQGEFMSTQSLRTHNGISIYNYQALCQTKLLVFDSKQLRLLLSETKKMIALGKEVKRRELLRLSKRDECLLQVKALDKYRKFIQFYPDLESQISQRHIASYLGITPISLSRLKKSMFLKTVIN